jgi:SAM-dependent methyltransferase
MNDSANAHVRRLIMGGVVAQAIAAVSELGVIDRLAANGPATAKELATALNADPDALQRFLRALAAEGLFTNEDDRFDLTDAGALLRSDVPGSLKYFSRLMTGEAYRVWEEAGYSLRTGQQAFNRLYHKPLFEWLAENPQRSAEFNEAQAELARLRLLPLLDISWAGVSTVVDVGGGNGQLLATLLDRHDTLSGILLDRPEVVEQAAAQLAGYPCQLVGGDFFEHVPAGGDVYVLAQILHDWDDDHAARILRRCHAAMRPGARLLILEQVVPEGGGPHPAKLLDLHMLVLLGGRERTDGDWRRLLASAGFTVTDLTIGPRSALIEATP